MSKPLQSVYDLKVTPRVLIEANAGTGKTYTIVGIFIRLLLEQKMSIDQVLVVTFTQKATAELRERILHRLRECLAVLRSEQVAGDDQYLIEFLNKYHSSDNTMELLQSAIHDFDECQVLTIHGFCQKVLNEEALYSGTPFDIEISQSGELIKQAVEDIWRVFVSKHGESDVGRYYISKLQEIASAPSDLIDKLSPLFGKPYALLEGDGPEDPLSILADVLRLRGEMKKNWVQAREEIRAELEGCDLKNFTSSKVKGWMANMDMFLSGDPISEESFKDLKYFTTDHHNDESNLKSKGTRIPRHLFFEECNRYSELNSVIAAVKTTLLKQLYNDIIKRLSDLSVNSGTMSFDDLLINVRDALKAPKRGSYLTEQLRRKYPFALVDEFQDTDPIQYEIFDAVYPREGTGHSLMMIGDPKQAIYGFRGADVYTYLKARNDGAGPVHSLQKNFRSTPELIQGINKLFSVSKYPFIEEKIVYSDSIPGLRGTGADYLRDGKSPVPISITARRGVEKNKETVSDFAVNETVRQISDLLERSEKGTVQLKGEKLQAGDIAVLVSGHKSAEEIKRRLKQVGVGAVTYSREKVFDTLEARRMALLMAAVLQPENHRIFHNALLSGFFGLNLKELYNLKETEQNRQELTEELIRLQLLWHQRGFYPMFRKFLFSGSRLSGLAVLHDSERVLTNLYQLADICSEAEKKGGLDPGSLYSWFTEQIASPDKDEEKMLLLESDQNLVKISTIHNSKGLEFPVVFCPFLWEGRQRKKNRLFATYHENSGQTVINVDQAGCERRTEAENSNTVESIAEEVRKVYVAITRAKYECRIIWGTHSLSHLSGLGAALIGRGKLMETLNSKLTSDSEINDQYFIRIFSSLKQEIPESIELNVTDGKPARTEKVNWSSKISESLLFRPYAGRAELPVAKTVESFSSLVYKKPDPAEPDHDQAVESYAEAFTRTEKDHDELSIFTFPRGTAAGTAIHKLFEHPGFDFSKARETDYHNMIREVMEFYHFHEQWVPILQKMLREVSSASFENLVMEKITMADQLREMEFSFPVSRPVADDLFRVIRGGSARPYSGQSGESYLTGFIDLIVRQNGKYYIMDYKSNYLGDSPENYAPGKLRDEMIAAGYDLQYHLYIVALVKYLRKRKPGFNYESDFGGAAYLFIRGMKAGSENGIWFHKPDEKIIRELEEVLDRG